MPKTVEEEVPEEEEDDDIMDAGAIDDSEGRTCSPHILCSLVFFQCLSHILGHLPQRTVTTTQPRMSPAGGSPSSTAASPRPVRRGCAAAWGDPASVLAWRMCPRTWPKVRGEEAAAPWWAGTGRRVLKLCCALSSRRGRGALGDIPEHAGLRAAELRSSQFLWPGERDQQEPGRAQHQPV